ncbi:Glycerate kinase [Corynebacterium pseudotuberculosis]|uniref:glycerate kinase n=1 Tax=Corynebacterium pseudotuberculosis TaxID=1719 RepID=UPI00065DE714|nr:glycerate kinase [Corynebacterium pseudotuberculosis]AKP09004.1 Glycerate kinase [Corynebacterium pseudotuberculosis]
MTVEDVPPLNLADLQQGSHRPLNIVIAPDSFKGTATAVEAAQYISDGINLELQQLNVPPESVTITLAPMADGGEGTSSVFSGEEITLPTTDAIGRLTQATYTFDATTNTAYIDVAAASGLSAVTDRLNPTFADTYGTGVLIADAQTRGATRIVLGLGGTATTDGGTGILVALGATPMDKNGLALKQGGAALIDLDFLDTAQLNIPAAAMDWVLLSDVTAPAIGPQGAASQFGPQKGASEEDIAQLDAGIAQLCKVSGVDPDTVSMGAAGALAVGITWLSGIVHGNTDHVRILPGARIVAQSLGLDSLAEHADILITGEGAFDAQSTKGKVVGAVLDLSGKNTLPVIIAGKFSDDAPQGTLPIQLAPINEVASTQDQLTRAGRSVVRSYLRISSDHG